MHRGVFLPCSTSSTSSSSTDYHEGVVTLTLDHAELCDDIDATCDRLSLSFVTNSYLYVLQGFTAVVFSVVSTAIIFAVAMILRERNIIELRTHIGVLATLSWAASAFSLAAVISWYTLVKPQFIDNLSTYTGERFNPGANRNPVGLITMCLCLILSTVIGIWTSRLLYKGVGGHWNAAAWFGAKSAAQNAYAPLSEKSGLLETSA